MKNKKIGIIALVIFMIVIVSQNIMLMNKTNKLIGTVPSRNIDSNEVEYTPKNKSVQASINELLSSAKGLDTRVSTIEKNYGEIISGTQVAGMIPPGQPLEIATITLPTKGTYLIFGTHRWDGNNISSSNLYYDQLGSIQYNGNMSSGGGILSFYPITTTEDNVTISYRTAHNGGNVLPIKDLVLRAVRIQMD